MADGDKLSRSAASKSAQVKKSRAIWWLLGLTAAYVAVFRLLMAETKACTDVPISPHWFFGFFDRYLGCRDLNELGDALAGAFAPIAFLWLAGAVFIQSKELQAQREDLIETREVMRAQLEVAKRQVAETKASTALFDKQTAILEAQRSDQIAEANDRNFDANFRSLKEVIGNSTNLEIRIMEYKAFPAAALTHLNGKVYSEGWRETNAAIPRLSKSDQNKVGQRLVTMNICDGFSVASDLLTITTAITRNSVAVHNKINAYWMPIVGTPIAIIENKATLGKYLQATLDILRQLEKLGGSLSESKKLTFFEGELSYSISKLDELRRQIDDHARSNFVEEVGGENEP